jgi:C4-dicarboxylate-specific signal transduction histidine kinase
MTALEAEKENIKKTSRANKARIEELTDRLTELRKQVKPDTARRESTRDRDRDDFGRMPRDQDEKMDEDKSGDVEKIETDDREKGVQIKGDDGDIEVEY